MNHVEIMRASHISRWTIVATARPQSLAEHTFNVMVLCREFCKRIGQCDVTMMKAAMEHDLDEIMTGDIPTPAKRRFREIGIDPKKLEKPMPHVDKLDKMHAISFKAIDIMEAIHYLDNYGTGKRASAIKESLSDAFHVQLQMLQIELGEWDNGRKWIIALREMMAELLATDIKDI